MRSASIVHHDFVTGVSMRCSLAVVSFKGPPPPQGRAGAIRLAIGFSLGGALQIVVQSDLNAVAQRSHSLAAC